MPAASFTVTSLIVNEGAASLSVIVAVPLALGAFAYLVLRDRPVKTTLIARTDP